MSEDYRHPDDAELLHRGGEPGPTPEDEYREYIVDVLARLMDCRQAGEFEAAERMIAELAPPGEASAMPEVNTQPGRRRGRRALPGAETGREVEASRW